MMLKLTSPVRWDPPRLATALWLAASLALAPAIHSIAGEDVRLAPSTPRPQQSRSDLQLLSDQRYSEQAGRAGLCDVYLPATPAPESGYPAVVVVHGGGWMSGDKWTLAGYSRLLAERGFVAITINYRLAPADKFPAQVDDVRQALLWTRAHAAAFSIDLNRLGIFGYSAGGHLAALVATLADEPRRVQAAASSWAPADPRWEQLPTLHAVCVGGPPSDFRSLPADNTTLAYFLGGSRREQPAVYQAASPAAHVSPDDPVIQIIHGESDLIVPMAGSQKYHQRLIEAGVDSRLVVMPGQGHMVTFLNPKTSDKVLEFFCQVLKSPAAPQDKR